MLMLERGPSRRSYACFTTLHSSIETDSCYKWTLLCCLKCHDLAMHFKHCLLPAMTFTNAAKSSVIAYMWYVLNLWYCWSAKPEQAVILGISYLMYTGMHGKNGYVNILLMYVILHELFSNNPVFHNRRISWFHDNSPDIQLLFSWIFWWNWSQTSLGCANVTIYVDLWHLALWRYLLGVKAGQRLGAFCRLTSSPCIYRSFCLFSLYYLVSSWTPIVFPFLPFGSWLSWLSMGRKLNK